MSLPQEILRKVKLLELNTRKLVNNVLSGEYHSAFKGSGITFSDFREYVPGDNVRAISWPLMARTGKPYIKKFDEERELSLLLAVDVSGSLDFGSGPYLKGEVITHLAALLGFSASRNKDRLGLLLFSDQVEHFVPPRKGQAQVHRILRDLYYHKTFSKKTSLVTALQYLQGVLKKHSLLFLLSDFIDEGYENLLRVMGKKYDTVALIIEDPLEKEIPSMGLINVSDPETGETLCVNSSSSLFKRLYKEKMKKDRELRDLSLTRAQVDKVYIECKKDFVKPLIRFFKSRRKK